MQDESSGVDGGDGCTTIWIFIIPLIYTVKMDKMINCMLCVFCHNKNWFMRISRYEIDKWVTSYLRHR